MGITPGWLVAVDWWLFVVVDWLLAGWLVAVGCWLLAVADIVVLYGFSLHLVVWGPVGCWLLAVVFTNILINTHIIIYYMI